MAPQDVSQQPVDNNVVMHDCNLLLRQNNMNVNPMDGINFRNQNTNNDHDVNVNRVQSPVRSISKYVSTP